MFFDMGLEGTGGPGWLSRVFRGPSWGLVIKKKHNRVSVSGLGVEFLGGACVDKIDISCST